MVGPRRLLRRRIWSRLGCWNDLEMGCLGKKTNWDSILFDFVRFLDHLMRCKKTHGTLDPNLICKNQWLEPSKISTLLLRKKFVVQQNTHDIRWWFHSGFWMCVTYQKLDVYIKSNWTTFFGIRKLTARSRWMLPGTRKPQPSFNGCLKLKSLYLGSCCFKKWLFRAPCMMFFPQKPNLLFKVQTTGMATINRYLRFWVVSCCFCSPINPDVSKAFHLCVWFCWWLWFV